VTLIGAPVRRVEDERLLTGRGRFVGDMVVKGVGEGGTIGAPAAVANATADALAPLGIDITELPMTPDRLFTLIHQREKRETP